MKPRLKLNIRSAGSLKSTESETAGINLKSTENVTGKSEGVLTDSSSTTVTNLSTSSDQISHKPESLPKLERRSFGPRSISSSTSLSASASGSTLDQSSKQNTPFSTRGFREKPITTITPTFLLKSVDAIKVLHDYLNGIHPSSRKLNHGTSASTCNLFALTPTYGTSVDSESYTYRHRNNIQSRVVTTNHELYSKTSELLDSKPVSSTSLPVHGKCMWCRIPIEHSPVGIPTSVEYISARQNVVNPLKAELVKKLIDTGTMRFDVDGQFCTFECCFAGLKQLYPPYHLMRNPLYMDSEQLLRLLYSSIYPNAKSFVQPAPDWRLLRDNGGPLEPKEFFSGTHIFIKTTNLVILPIKVEYVVQKAVSI